MQSMNEKGTKCPFRAAKVRKIPQTTMPLGCKISVRGIKKGQITLFLRKFNF